LPLLSKNRTSGGDEPAFRRARCAGKFPILVPSALLFLLIREGQRRKPGFIAKRCLAQVLKEIGVNIPHVHETETQAFAGERPRRPLRRGWLLGYIGVVVLFVLAVIFQVFLAGAGILVAGSWLVFHAAFGDLIILFPLLLLLPCGLIARLPRSLNWLTALLALLALIQPLLLWRTRLGPGFLPAFHPVNALLMFALTLFLGGRAWNLARQEERKR
jgi:hypothetical protein